MRIRGSNRVVGDVSAGLKLREVITERPKSPRACPAGVFPFGFGGKAIDPVLLLAEPVTKSGCVVETDMNDRMVVALIKSRILPIEFRSLFKAAFGDENVCASANG